MYTACGLLICYLRGQTCKYTQAVKVLTHVRTQDVDVWMCGCAVFVFVYVYVYVREGVRVSE